MKRSDIVLLRLEAAMAPDSLEKPLLAVSRTDMHGREYWQSGFVVALTEARCNQQAADSRLSRANIPPSLKRIPWC